MDYNIFKLHHRGMECIGVRLSREDSRNKTIRQLPGIRWSKTHTCWYGEDTAEFKTKLSEIVESTSSGTHQFHDAKADSGQMPEPDIIVTSLSEYTLFNGDGKTPGGSIKKSSTSASEMTKEKFIPWQDVDKFTNYLKVKRYSKESIQNYEKSVIKFLRYFHNRDWRKLSKQEIEQFQKECIIDKGLSFSYQSILVSALKHFYKQVSGIEPDLDFLERPRRPQKLPKVLSKEAIADLLGSVKNQKHRLMLSLAYGCGLRAGDVLGLKFEQIDTARGLINIKKGKGNKDRTIPLSARLIEMINEYMRSYKPVNWLFEGQRRGERYSERSLQEVFKHALSASKIEGQYTLHCLRHSYATHLMEAGTATRVIQEILGHKNSKTTEIYTHVSKTLIQKVRSPFDDLNL